MANKDVLQITFDADSKEFEKSLLNSMNSISDKASEKLAEAFTKAGKNPKLKKQLTGVYQGLFDELSEASGDMDQINEAIDRFTGKIEYIDTIVKKSKIKGLFDNLSIGNVDKLLANYDKIIEKEKNIAKYSSDTFRDETRNKTAIKSLKELEKTYGDIGESRKKYEEQLAEYVKSTGIDTSAITKEIKAYSSLVALFEEINTTKVGIGTEDAVKRQQALLYVMKQIQEIESGATLFSNFRNKELLDVKGIKTSLSGLSQQLEGSITSLVKSITKPIENTISEMYENIIKEALKMSKHQAIADVKTQAKVGSILSKGAETSGQPVTETSSETIFSDDSVDGFDIWVKSAQELENEFRDVIKYATDAEKTLERINDIWKRYDSGEKIKDGEIDEMYALMKRLDSLEQNRIIEKTPLNKEQLEEFNEILFDDAYEEKFTRIDELTDKQIKKIEELKTAQKNDVLNGVDSSTNNIDDSKVGELREEIKEVKEDIISLKGRVDTLEDTTAFDNLSSQVTGFDEKLKNVDGSIEKLVSSFKLLSELSLTDLQKVAIPFFNGINQVYQENDGNHISVYWDKLKEEIEGSNIELRELLKLVGLYDSKSNSLKLISDGMVNSGGLIGDDHVLIARKNKNDRFEQVQALKKKLDEAHVAGINVSRILDVIGTKESDVFLELQETARGNVLGNIYGQLDKDFINTDWLEATDDQIKKLISDMISLQKMGINVESNLTNIMYDKEKGFSFIDMDLDVTKFENDAELMQDHMIRIFGDLEDFYLDQNDTANANMIAKARERFENLSKQVQQAYAKAQDSNSPSKEFEKLENDAVDGIVEGANKNEGKLKNVGKQMADNIKEGFKEGISDADTDTTALSSGDKSSVLSKSQTEVLSGTDISSSISSDIDSEKSKLKELEFAISSVIEEIDRKTQAFHNEKAAVDMIIPSEIATLEALEGELITIRELLEQISKVPIDISFKTDNLDENTQKVLDEIRESLNGIDTSSLSNISSVLEGFKISNSNVENLQKLANAILTLKSNLNNVGSQGQQFLSDIKELVAQADGLKDLATILKSTADKINSAKKVTSDSKIDEFVPLKGWIQDPNKAQADAYKASGIDYIEEIERKLSSIKTDDKTPGYLNKLEEINKIVSELKTKVPIDFTNPSKISELEDAKQSINNMFSNLKNLESVSSTEIDTLTKRIYKDLRTNTAAPRDLRMQLEALGERIDQMKKSTNSINKIEFDQLKAELVSLESQIEKTGKTGLSMGDKISKKFKDVFAYFTTYVSIYDAINVFRQGFEVIKEYDIALTEMNKVSDESIHTLKEFQSESFELADAIGATAQQIQNSTADWMRLGETLEEAKQSAQDTTVLFNVSEFENIDEATEALTSMSQAYKDLEKMEIVDVVNNLGNNFAISTDGLATALQNSASSLLTAKNDFYEAAALTTAANTVVQDPDKVGAGLRTIALRLTGTEAAKKELEELGEDTEGMVVTTVSKLDQKIKDLTKTQGNFGVSLLDMNGNYRSTYEVLLDIAKVWDQIAKEDLETGENRQNALLEMMAGKNRSNILASVLQSPEVLEEAYSYALDSDGSAFKENEAHLESIQGHLDQLKNKWDNLWINENNREVITFFLDLAKSVLDVTNEFGVLNTILVGGGGVFAAIKSIQGKGRLKQSSLIFMQISFKYALSDVCPYGYISFLITLYEIHRGKRSDNLLGSESTLWPSPLLVMEEGSEKQ